MLAPRILIPLVALLLAACAGDGDDAAPTTTAEPTNTTITTTIAGELVDPPPPAATDIDCEAMADPLFELSFSNQFLAQLVSNDQFELIADGTVDVDFAAVREAVAALRPLDSVENPLGSVDEGLDRIDRAAALAAVAAESDDPESTAAFAELQTVIGDDAAFIGSIGPVNYAFGEAGCF